MRRALVLFFCLLLALACLLPAGAEEVSEMPEEYEGLIEALPGEVRGLLPDDLLSNDPETILAALSEFGNFSSILSILKELLLQILNPALELFFSVLGILLLSRILEEVGASFSSGGLASAFSFLQKLLLVTLLLGFGYQSLSGVTDYFGALGNLTRAALPLFGTLYAMGGNVSAAVASSAGLGASLGLVEGLVGSTILPLCALCLGFTVVELFTPFPTKTLTDSLKKNYTTILSGLMVILLALLGTQTTLGAKADSLAAKGAKYAAGAIIPVAGGSVSELLLSVGNGVSYLRGICGASGLLLLFLTFLPSGLTLLCHRLLWQAAESLSDLFGLSKEKRLFSEFASLCGYLLTALIVCSSALFLSFVLAMNCAGAWG